MRAGADNTSAGADGTSDSDIEPGFPKHVRIFQAPPLPVSELPCMMHRAQRCTETKWSSGLGATWRRWRRARAARFLDAKGSEFGEIVVASAVMMISARSFPISDHDDDDELALENLMCVKMMTMKNSESKQRYSKKASHTNWSYSKVRPNIEQSKSSNENCAQQRSAGTTSRGRPLSRTVHISKSEGGALVENIYSVREGQGGAGAGAGDGPIRLAALCHPPPAILHPPSAHWLRPPTTRALALTTQHPPPTTHHPSATHRTNNQSTVSRWQVDLDRVR